MLLISGANSQIGSFLARAYQAEGRELICLYHERKQRLEGIQAPLLQADLMNYHATEAILQQYLPRITQAIHCSAVRSEDHRALADTEPVIFHKVIEQNIYPAYHILRLLLPAMRAQAFGRIVLFSSDVSQTGLPMGSAYAAAKAAIANMAKSSAQENAGMDVLINSIAPGPVETAMEQDFSEEYLEFRRKYFSAHLQRTASGKLVTMEEIKLLTDMLISAKLRNLCGEELVINGGKK